MLPLAGDCDDRSSAPCPNLKISDAFSSEVLPHNIGMNANPEIAQGRKSDLHRFPLCLDHCTRKDASQSAGLWWKKVYHHWPIRSRLLDVQLGSSGVQKNYRNLIFFFLFPVRISYQGPVVPPNALPCTSVSHRRKNTCCIFLKYAKRLPMLFPLRMEDVRLGSALSSRTRCYPAKGPQSGIICSNTMIWLSPRDHVLWLRR